MKLLLASALIISTGAARAALEVDVVTSRGTITAELHHDLAPTTVANFLTLAAGTRSWVDSNTGAVRSLPFYDGLDFHQVENTASLKVIGTGSRTGGGDDRPGFAFPDEFDPSLTHRPYVLAMDNSGPNTNGSRVYFNGDTALPDRDGRHTVFGSVTRTSSRAVIDAILAAGPDTTTITTVTIRRNDVPTSVFDELTVDLPAVTAVTPDLHVVPGSSTTVMLTQPAATEFRAWQSTGLQTWSPHFRRFIAAGSPAPGPALPMDDTPAPRSFFLCSLTTCPESLGPSGFTNRTLTTESPGVGTLVYTFDTTGSAGTYENIINDPIFGDVVFFEGSFVVRNEIPAHFGPYSFEVLLHLFDEELGGSPLNHIRGGYDANGPAGLTGRHLTSFLDPAMIPVFDESGALELTHP